MDRTLLLIKPDAVKRKLIGRLISRFEDKGLVIENMRMLQFDRELAEKHYEEHRGKSFFEPLCQFICQGPVVALQVAGQDAVSVTRQIMGKTAYGQAKPGTIRGDFATSTMDNLIHGSDSPERAQKELELFFGKGFDKPSVI